MISAGTRNHFALDLGLDRDDPASCLTALTDGEEVRVDLGLIGDRPFVNNELFGAYAEIVQSPEYRDNKNKTILAMLPDLLDPNQGSRLTGAHRGADTDRPAGGPGQQQPLRVGPAAGPGPTGADRPGGARCCRRAIASAAEAAALLRRAQFRTVTNLVGDGDVVIMLTGRATDRAGRDSGRGRLRRSPGARAGPLLGPAPRALRVRLPRERPGVPVLPDPINLKRLAGIALRAVAAGPSRSPHWLGPMRSAWRSAAAQTPGGDIRTSARGDAG